VWAEDASFWKSEESHRRTIESALGWLTIADRMESGIPELRAFASDVSRDTDRVVVLGMGGSSLAPLVFSDSFPAAAGSPRLEVLDSTEPASVLATLGGAPASRTMYVVSSKSGTTLEPNVFFDFFFAQAEKELGDRAGERFLVVTDPGSALEKEAGKRRVRRIFPGDPRIGGRYSALSNFGMVPAALAGIDVAELLRRAREMAQMCRRPGRDNPGLTLGAAIASLALTGHDKLTFDVGAPIGRFGMWTEQLVAESTGKEGKGILPVEGEPLGGVSDYGRDRLFAALRRSTDDDGWRHVERLVSGGHPAARASIDDALDLGAQMFLWEFATAVAGRVLGINPFDQPNVQEAKDKTNEILAGGGAGTGPGAAGAGTGEIPELLASIRPGDYFAILAYVPSTEEHELLLSETRLRVRDGKRVATTVGFGPRFLHSTGQFHKGGPPSGVFLQITAEPREDVAIPGRSWSFGEVVAAQAAGDLAALRSRGRRAARVHLGPDVAAGLRELDRAVAGALETGGGR
jgi:glucose-6-phosphate isomerase